MQRFQWLTASILKQFRCEKPGTSSARGRLETALASGPRAYLDRHLVQTARRPWMSNRRTEHALSSRALFLTFERSTDQIAALGSRVASTTRRNLSWLTSAGTDIEVVARMREGASAKLTSSSRTTPPRAPTLLRSSMRSPPPLSTGRGSKDDDAIRPQRSSACQVGPRDSPLYLAFSASASIDSSLSSRGAACQTLANDLMTASFRQKSLS